MGRTPMEEARLDDQELSDYLREARPPIAQAVRGLREEILDDEVKEERTGPQASQLGYSVGCSLFATLRPAPDRLEIDLWVGPDRQGEATAAGWARHPHALRAKFGWVRREVAVGDDPPRLARWLRAAKDHARAQPQR